MRRSIHEQLAGGPATIGELAQPFHLTQHGGGESVGVASTNNVQFPAGLTSYVIDSYIIDMELRGQLEVTSWQEDEIRALTDSGGKVTRASIGYRVTGDVDGEAADDVLMYYRSDGVATAVGLWHLSGSVAGRTGGVMFASSGDYDGTTALSQVRSISESGTGGFTTLSGTGTMSATGERVEFVLDLEF